MDELRATAPDHLSGDIELNCTSNDWSIPVCSLVTDIVCGLFLFCICFYFLITKIYFITLPFVGESTVSMHVKLEIIKVHIRDCEWNDILTTNLSEYRARYCSLIHGKLGRRSCIYRSNIIWYKINQAELKDPLRPSMWLLNTYSYICHDGTPTKSNKFIIYIQQSRVAHFIYWFEFYLICVNAEWFIEVSIPRRNINNGLIY